MSKTQKPDSTGRRREPPLDFIRTIVRDDLADGKHPKVVTRFPPEPNGFLHIGHAKSICLNFGVAREFGGQCNLRFDDTDPAKEDTVYVEAIKDNIRWLGFDWGEGLYNASDYFEELYRFALQLIERGGAYICSLSEAEIRETRGTVTEPGRESPYRSRGVDENLDLFARMRNGEFPDGAHVLRARIDMASPNMKMRDPVIYRIRHVTHHHTGDAWPIYPMYDFAHPAVGRAGGGDPLALHPRVREQPRVLRLDSRTGGRPLQPAADRVRPAEPRLYRHEQAAAAGIGGG